MSSGARPSRTGRDHVRRTQAIADSVSRAWGRVRMWYPEKIRSVVDQLSESGGLSMTDLATISTAQMLRDLEAGESSQVTSTLRLLFRIAVVSGGVTDADAAPVRIPDGLLDIEPSSDTGDDLL